MTALAPAADTTAEPESTDSDSVRARIRGLPAAVRASEYLTVGRSRRFRAIQRRRTRSVARAGLLVAAAAVTIDATVLLGLGNSSVAPPSRSTGWSCSRRSPVGGCFLAGSTTTPR